MDNFKEKYFLGANSCEGFCSFFDKCYIADGEWHAYIIKGGPGTGKSSFMKFVAAKAAEKEIKTVLCPCSSDPDSLDAIILPDKKVVVLDGTAPHTVDPAYPGACEKILNFSDFWDDKSFTKNRCEIIEMTDRNKALHRVVSRYMQATGQLISDNYKTALACTDRVKTAAYAQNLCKRLIPQRQGTGKEWVRFISGITPKGVVSYSGTLLELAENTVIIDDEFGSASNIIVNIVRDYALAAGYEIITLKNPFLPSQLTDHVIIPELSLAVVTENDYIHFNRKVRRIHSRRFVSAKKLHLSRERMKFNRKAIKQFLLSAMSTLAGAKAVHDELETFYIEAMDFKTLTAFANKFTENLLS